jgi:hypothetical protein
MREQWYFDCEGPAGDERWCWRRIGGDGSVLEESRRFRYYLDARNDAELHGFVGDALFGSPTSKTSPA